MTLNDWLLQGIICGVVCGVLALMILSVLVNAISIYLGIDESEDK